MLTRSVSKPRLEIPGPSPTWNDSAVEFPARINVSIRQYYPVRVRRLGEAVRNGTENELVHPLYSFSIVVIILRLSLFLAIAILRVVSDIFNGHEGCQPVWPDWIDDPKSEEGCGR